MPQTLVSILTSVLGVLTLMGLWLAVQLYLRRKLQLPADADVLQDMLHGCGNCEESGSCGTPASEKLITIQIPSKKSLTTTKSVTTDRRQPV